MSSSVLSFLRSSSFLIAFLLLNFASDFAENFIALQKNEKRNARAALCGGCRKFEATKRKEITIESRSNELRVLSSRTATATASVGVRSSACGATIATDHGVMKLVRCSGIRVMRSACDHVNLCLLWGEKRLNFVSGCGFHYIHFTVSAAQTTIRQIKGRSEREHHTYMRVTGNRSFSSLTRSIRGSTANPIPRFNATNAFCPV